MTRIDKALHSPSFSPSFPSDSWLIPEEQDQLVAALLKYEIIKTSNKRDLPLKMGGTTDIYINLREARNYPEAISFVADAFRNPLMRLRTDRFVEVPDAVSCFAGSISERMQLPIVTIREEAKAGRVVKGKLIGKLLPGEIIAIIDDVITDGASKITPYNECLKYGVNPSLIVLVDRQQGWKKKFASEGVSMPVWPGMTLHDIRYRLINTFGVMERCDLALEEQNPIIIALDGKSWEEYLPLIDQLRVTGCTFKVNDLLHDQSHRDIVRQLATYGRVMVDAKAHDIPNTVANITKQYRDCAPWAMTIQGSGGEDMIRQAVNVLDPVGTNVLVVTVLTSMDKKTCEEVYSRRPMDEVLALAEIGNRAGAHGFVCSPQELPRLKKLYPDKLFVIPGVRSPNADKNDQSRTATPAFTIKRGANRVVMGRQILGAKNPVEEVYRVLRDELQVKI